MDNSLIKRQAAIDATWFEPSYTDPLNVLTEVRDRLKALPSAQPEQRWIPCSEETGDGYPEEDGFYYVTEQNYGFYLDADCKQRVTHTSHFKNGDFTDRFYTENHSNITAWMPLPEPYQEDIE